jgi:dipeptidyl aminopeptidase/acylaminoacyl peptidase
MKTNAVKPLTTGTFFVNSILDIHAKDGLVYFLASGKEPGRNPYEQYLYSVSMDGKKLKLITTEPGNHEITLSPDMQFITDTYSTPQQQTRTWLRDCKSGKVLQELSKANISGLVSMKWTAPEPFTALGKDGKSTIYGLLWKPTNFDASKKYPIIDNSYTGPHGQIVPRTFTRGISVNNQSLAELGFVVMMIDGLGTAGRSKEFHNHSYKRMGYNLEDHVRAIRQLSSQYAWIDTTRVGIFGHSAGGYDAGHAMMQYPDFYKVAVASSADHDFRMEKAWWPEMYMGWPVDSTYHQQSTITMANKLKGKLLITHGGIDENVNPSATFKLAEMLVRADKQFDMLIFPSQKHGYTGPQQYYFTKKRWNYFVEHLRGEKPIWEFPWK